MNRRTFEYLTGAPCLNAQLVVEMVQGIQSQNIAARSKHFTANNQETSRMRNSSEVSQRYCVKYTSASEVVVTQADTWCVMVAYNAINGTAALTC